MNEMHLAIFHVGPVQDFIATARRSRDLWFSSWLLSELSRAAALEIVKQNGNDVACLVFPAPSNLAELHSEDFNVSNKIVALVKQLPVQLGTAVQEAILTRLRRICNEAYEKVSPNFDRKTAEKQVYDMLEFFWVACPTNGDYSQARVRAESLMAARKATRDFPAVPWGDNDSRSVPKSSLDGQRESVIPETAYPPRNAPKEQRTEIIRKLRVDFGVRGEGERLCGVGLLKRHGKRGSGGDRFFSTSHVAALPLLERLTDQRATDEYINRLKALEISSEELGNAPRSHPVFSRYDGHLLFEERLSEFIEDTDKLEEAKEALSKFRRAAFSDLPEEHRSPIPYYALLLADGDRMGEAINKLHSENDHRAFSQHLARFARSVANIVANNKGSLVYSGGDDVLAFVPLHTVLKCAYELAGKFREPVNLYGNPVPIHLTLSVGVVVAHHIEPLSDVLALARASEKTAKSVDGKNALAVTVSKRSGIDRTVAGSWGTLAQRLERFIVLHRTDAIPDGAAYELQDLAQRLKVSPDHPEHETLQRAMRTESMRILRRKESQRGLHPIAKEVLQELEGLINRDKLTIAELADELIIVREFAAAQEQAKTPLETTEVKKP